MNKPCIVFIIVMATPFLAQIIHTCNQNDKGWERVRQEMFQRKVNRKALPGPRPKDKPLGEVTAKSRSYLSALADWWKGGDYDEEWITMIMRFENEPLFNGTIEYSTVHQDRLNKKVKEVGYGITDAEISEAKRFGLLPADATLPQRMSKEDADKWFRDITLPAYERQVEEIVKVPLTREQKFALISFCHNLGKGNLAKLVGQKDRLNDSNYAVIARCIPLYTRAGKSSNIAGLVKRREWEARLWQSGTNNYSSEIAQR